MLILKIVSIWAIPIMLIVIPIYAYVQGVKVYEVFCEGAKEGLQTAIRILPFLVAIFVALAIFRESHALETLLMMIRPVAAFFGFPPEVIPLAIVRPLSGSGALAILANIIEQYGPDSLVGMMASTMMGSTETTFYILTVYLGAVGITRSRHAMVVGLIADIAGFSTAIYITMLALK